MHPEDIEKAKDILNNVLNTSADDVNLGQLAFESYGQACDWTTFDGRPMPNWEQVGPRVRNLWTVAAAAIVSHCMTNGKLTIVCSVLKATDVNVQ